MPFKLYTAAFAFGLLSLNGPAFSESESLSGRWLCQETQFFGETEGLYRGDFQVTPMGTLDGSITLTFFVEDGPVVVVHSFASHWSVEDGKLVETPDAAVLVSATKGEEDLSEEGWVTDLAVGFSAVEDPLPMQHWVLISSCCCLKAIMPVS